VAAMVDEADDAKVVDIMVENAEELELDEEVDELLATAFRIRSPGLDNSPPSISYVGLAALNRRTYLASTSKEDSGIAIVHEKLPPLEVKLTFSIANQNHQMLALSEKPTYNTPSNWI